MVNGKRCAWNRHAMTDAGPRANRQLRNFAVNSEHSIAYWWNCMYEWFLAKWSSDIQPRRMDYTRGLYNESGVTPRWSVVSVLERPREFCKCLVIFQKSVTPDFFVALLLHGKSLPIFLELKSKREAVWLAAHIQRCIIRAPADPAKIAMQKPL